MASIDERVVSMAFENAKFEAGVATTLKTLAKLEEAIKNIGDVNALAGFANIQSASQKVTMEAPMSALDKLKAKLSFRSNDIQGLSDVEKASEKITMEAPMSALDKLKAKLGRSPDDTAKFDNIEESSKRVTLVNPLTAIGKLTAAVAGIGAGAVAGFRLIDAAADKVGMGGLFKVVDKLQSRFTGINFSDTASNIDRAADRVTLNGLTKAVEGASHQFSILEGAAAVALGNIATQALNRGKAFAKSFTLAPIQQGFEEYSTNLSSIQTILANTDGQKKSGLKNVNAALAELNNYSDKTIYNFSEMAKNIGTFTAAGVDLDQSTQSIKGIANLAALSGSNSQQASTAMYQLSQAISSGRVGLQDWNSVVNAGMGGAVFQKALMRTAENMGTIEKGAMKIDKATGKATINGESFRESITAKPGQKSWLSSDVLVKTLGQFTGDLKKADLQKQGFDDKQIAAIQRQAKTAQDAATQVKTFSQVIDVAKETIGSGWSKTFQLVFGNFEQAKKTFTGLSNAINDFINGTSKARNNLLQGWSDLNGRQTLIVGLKNAFAALASVLKPIYGAFREIFPPMTARELVNLTARFRDLMADLKLAPKTAENVKRTFAGFFAVLHIGWTIVKRVIGIVGDLLGSFNSGGGGLLEFTGNLGDFLVQLDKAISSGHAMDAIFGGLTKVLSAPIHVVKTLGRLLSDLFGGKLFGDGASAMSTAPAELADALGPLGGIVETLMKAFDKLKASMKGVVGFMKPIFTTVVDTVSTLGDKIIEGINNIDMNGAMAALQTALTGGIFLVLKKAIGGGVSVSFFKDAQENITSMIDSLNGSLKALQTNIKANTLLQIAIAVGVLAAGVLVMSKIDPKDLSRAMGAVAVGLGELVGALKLLTGLKTGIATLPVIAASMIMIAVALDVLSIAIFAFSRLSWEELAKGIAGVAGALVGIGVGIQAFPPKILGIGIALLPIAAAMILLAVAMRIFGGLDWKGIVKGMTGMAGAVEIMVYGLKAMGPSLQLAGPGLLFMAGAMAILAVALGLFGSMDMVTMAKGILGMTAALTVLGWAISAFPPTLILSAAGLVVLGIAMGSIATAVGLMGSLGILTLAKGLIGLGAALTILAVGLYLMVGTLPGAVALLAAAAALAILGPALLVLGSLPLGTLIKGLGAMALSLGVIAVVGLVAAPALALMGVALLALGIGVTVLSTGVYILAKGLSLLGNEGVKGVAVMVTAVTAFVALIPKILIDLVKGLVSVVEEVAKVAPKVAIALGVVIDSLLTTIIEAAPKLAIAAGSLIDAFLVVIGEKAGPLIDAGIKLLQHFLEGVNQNIDSVSRKASEILQKFFTRMTAEAPLIIQKGADTLSAFLQGIADNLPRVLNHAARVGLAFLDGIAQNAPKFVSAGARAIRAFLNRISAEMPTVLSSGVTVIVQFINGIASGLPRIVAAGYRLIRKFIFAIANELPKMVDAGFKAVIKFMNGVAHAIRTNTQPMIDAGFNLADAIIDGMVLGFKQLGHKAISAVGSLISAMPKKALKLLKINSPSKVFADIGRYTMLGLVQGIDGGAGGVGKSVDRAANGMISAFSDVPDMLGGLVDMDPVISPVLDLTHVQKNAKKLGDLTAVAPITATASIGQASTLTQDVAATQAVQAQAAADSNIKLEFNQTNTSPVALSDVEIYRKTNNQLSLARRAIGIAA